MLFSLPWHVCQNEASHPQQHLKRLAEIHGRRSKHLADTVEVSSHQKPCRPGIMEDVAKNQLVAIIRL
jgi:hypothetical protein